MTNACPFRSVAVVLLALVGCSTAPVKTAPPPQNFTSVRPALAPDDLPAGTFGSTEGPKISFIDSHKPITIRVIGRGAAPYSKALTPTQRKLLALRAAKLDAFRAIAEQIQGVKLVGNSSVANMVTVSDSFRTFVDGYLRGVHVISTSLEPDGTTQAIAEITLDKDFYKAYKSTLEQINNTPQATNAYKKYIDPTENEQKKAGANPTQDNPISYNSNYYVSQ